MKIRDRDRDRDRELDLRKFVSVIVIVTTVEETVRDRDSRPCLGCDWDRDRDQKYQSR
ncbi:unnamed protein product, partial [Rotaria sordida]